MEPQKRMGIYAGYDSPSMIRYLEPSTMGLFMAQFTDCHFDESVFPTLGGDKKHMGSEISWNELSLSHLDPRTKECEQEAQRIIHLQGLANQLPDVFIDLKRITKSHIPAANALVKIDVLKEHLEIANESKARLKRGRPIGSKVKNPQKKKKEHVIKMVKSKRH
nr:putative copia-like polyprotein [Tanacetum cinerariifolium]